MTVWSNNIVVNATSSISSNPLSKPRAMKNSPPRPKNSVIVWPRAKPLNNCCLKLSLLCVKPVFVCWACVTLTCK